MVLSKLAEAKIDDELLKARPNTSACVMYRVPYGLITRNY